MCKQIPNFAAYNPTAVIMGKSGYNRTFLGRSRSLKLPVLNLEQKNDVVRYEGNKYVLDYIHYSLVMSKKRRFAYYTAVNIDGARWVNNNRSGRWKKDLRIDESEQYDEDLYNAKANDFDRGHLVKREDPEWGEPHIALMAGDDTFRYTNCVPQHRKLNQEIWEELENNILLKGAINKKLKISVFTGPVLSENDGIFVKRVENQEVRIPDLFWKVISWVKSDGKTYAVGFIQSQEKFLLEDGIIKKKELPTAYNLRATDDDYFEHIKFKDGKTYQVKIEEIEKLTGLKFDWPKVIRPYKNSTPSLVSEDKRSGYSRKNALTSANIKRRPSLMLKGLHL
jgi:endonuclease G